MFQNYLYYVIEDPILVESEHEANVVPTLPLGLPNRNIVENSIGRQVAARTTTIVSLSEDINRTSKVENDYETRLIDFQIGPTNFGTRLSKANVSKDEW